MLEQADDAEEEFVGQVVSFKQAECAGDDRRVVVLQQGDDTAENLLVQVNKLSRR